MTGNNRNDLFSFNSPVAASTSDADGPDMTAAGPKFKLTASRQFTAWLADQCVSLAFTTYQTGKLLLIGLRPDGRLSVFERTFNRCMGLWASPQTLYMSSLYQLWRFDNALESGQVHNGYDRLYVPPLGDTPLTPLGDTTGGEHPGETISSGNSRSEL